MKQQQRLLVGKQIHDGTMSPSECMEKYNVGYTSACSYHRQYEESVGLPKADGKGKPSGASGDGQAASGYETMGKGELIRELMRRDIEVARLKKGTR